MKTSLKNILISLAFATFSILNDVAIAQTGMAINASGDVFSVYGYKIGGAYFDISFDQSFGEPAPQVEGFDKFQATAQLTGFVNYAATELMILLSQEGRSLDELSLRFDKYGLGTVANKSIFSFQVQKTPSTAYEAVYGAGWFILSSEKDIVTKDLVYFRPTDLAHAIYGVSVVPEPNQVQMLGNC